MKHGALSIFDLDTRGSLIVPQLRGLDLDPAYQQMAEDKTREGDALEWVEEMIGDAEVMR